MYTQIINSIIYPKVVFWLVIDIWINDLYLFKKCEFMHHYIFPQLFGGQMSAGVSFQSYWATLYTTEVGGLKSLFTHYWMYEYHMADIIHNDPASIYHPRGWRSDVSWYQLSVTVYIYIYIQTSCIQHRRLYWKDPNPFWQYIKCMNNI